MVEFLAALGAPLQKLDGAVDGNVFFVAGDQKRDRAFWLAAIVGEILQHRGDAAGDAALHVDRAAAIEKTVLDLAGERAERPCGFVTGRHHVGMSGKGDVRRFSPDAGVEVVDIGCAGLGEGHAVAGEAGCGERLFKHPQGTGVGRGYRGAADEIAGNGESIGHVLRLTCMPPGGLALGGTISSSLCWSQLCGGGVDAELSSTSASGSGPNRLLAQAAAQTEHFDEPPQPGNLHDQDDRKDPSWNRAAGPRTG